MAARDYGQYDGVTRALELVGERWALLLVRDLLAGPRRYGELAAGLPRVPSNILATRLKELQDAGIIRRAPRSRVIVYELTAYGSALEPAVRSLEAWGLRALGEPRDGQVLTPDALALSLRTVFRAGVAASLPPTSYLARVHGGELHVVVHGAELRVDRDDSASDLEFAAGPELHQVLAGHLSPAGAVHAGVVEVRRGPAELLDRFATTFSSAA